MHSKSDKVEVMTYDNANEVIKEIFEALISRYQIGLEILRAVSLFLTVLIYCITNVINVIFEAWWLIY